VSGNSAAGQSEPKAAFQNGPSRGEPLGQLRRCRSIDRERRVVGQVGVVGVDRRRTCFEPRCRADVGDRAGERQPQAGADQAAAPPSSHSLTSRTDPETDVRCLSAA
jgi:hypothetical protein